MDQIQHPPINAPLLDPVNPGKMNPIWIRWLKSFVDVANETNTLAFQGASEMAVPTSVSGVSSLPELETGLVEGMMDHPDSSSIKKDEDFPSSMFAMGHTPSQATQGQDEIWPMMKTTETTGNDDALTLIWMEV